MSGVVHGVCRLVTGKSNAGPADPTTEAASEGQVWVECRDFAVLPLSPFVFKIVPTAVFKGRDSLVDGMSPGFTLKGKSRPLVVVKVENTRGPFSGSHCTYSLGSQCYGTQRIALHRAQPWGCGDSPSGRRALHNVAASSVT